MAEKKKSKTGIIRHHMTAGQKVRAGDFRGAVAEYREILKMDPRDTQALQMMAQSMIRLNNPKEAIKYGERAVAANPSDFNALRMMAEMHLAMRDKKKAQKYTQEALANPPEDMKLPKLMNFALAVFGWIPPVGRYKASKREEMTQFNEYNKEWLEKAKTGKLQPPSLTGQSKKQRIRRQ